MVRFDNVSKVYRTRTGTVRSLDGVSLTVAQGEFVAVRGPSGCGKTTLLLGAGGMLRPSDGTIRIAGHELYALTPAERARFRATHIGFVFQMFHLVPYLTVLENVLLAAVPTRTRDAGERAVSLLDGLGLTPRLQHRPADLSTGERQRTAIARALLNQPQLLLADEPTGNLDPDNADEVFHHLREFQRGGGTVLVVTHGPTPEHFADRVIQLHGGRTVETAGG
jgi:ABC-type lipoprotein export system ATPase subunit